MLAISSTRYRYNYTYTNRRKRNHSPAHTFIISFLSLSLSFCSLPLVLQAWPDFLLIFFPSLSAGFVFTRRVDCLDYRSTTLTTAWELIGTTSLAADIDDHRERDPRVFVCTRKKILLFYLAR